ncbi:MAG: spore coat associated protein CotJA [Clostridiaceae bacterium]|nr:spore coat associated protein CotJA [Clostridiaceae bacterium]
MPGSFINGNTPCYPQQCIPQETVICNVKLARAYVPFQRLCSIYSPDMALKAGTAFPELHQPYKTTKNKPDCSIMPLREESNHVLE